MMLITGLVDSEDRVLLYSKEEEKYFVIKQNEIPGSLQQIY
jgi:hypothetical protein